MTESNRLKDYYRILGLKRSASSWAIFKHFRKRFLKVKASKEVSKELWCSYAILQEPSRKYYDLVLKQESLGKSPNPKYLRVLEQRDKEAKLIYYQQTKFESIKGELKEIDFGRIALNFFELIMGGGIDYSAIAILFLLGGLSGMVYGIIHSSALIALPFAMLGALGLWILNYAIMKFRKESIDKWLQKKLLLLKQEKELV